MNQIDSETVSFAPDDAVLVLEDGQVYVGDSYGAIGKTTGEIVFATGMTGYQETLTDPSYDRQIVVQTFPHIGDTGINGEDPESSRIWVAGYVVRDPSPNVSNWRATGSLDDDLESNHRDFFFGCHIAFLSHMNQWRASRPGIRAALCMPETLTFKQKRTAQNVISNSERSLFARERFLNHFEQYQTQRSATQTGPHPSAGRVPYRPR